MADDADKTVILIHGQPMIVTLSGGTRYLDHFARLFAYGRTGKGEKWIETCEGRQFRLTSRGQVPGWIVPGDEGYTEALEEMVTELTKEKQEADEFGSQQETRVDEAEKELASAKDEADMLRAALEEVTSLGFVRSIEAGFATDTALRLFPVEKRPS